MADEEPDKMAESVAPVKPAHEQVADPAMLARQPVTLGVVLLLLSGMAALALSLTGFLWVRIEKLDDKIDHKVDDSTRMLRNEIQYSAEQVRSELRETASQVRSEIQSSGDQLRSEMRDLRLDLKAIGQMQLEQAKTLGRIEALLEKKK